ncbi:MAG: hypothetical protein PHT32_00940 [Candidatus Omnitrophica bacterium]|nr:hypothetical protein [Candidatus Omnitrophota bacterium]
MIPENYKSIIRKLFEKTNEGKVVWQSTSDDNTFIVEIGDFTLKIWDGRDDEIDEPFVGFTLLNSKGKQIDNFWADKGSKDYDSSYALYASARRKALKIDDAINSIAKKLESDEIVGEIPEAPF